jgi:putative endonuclease
MHYVYFLLLGDKKIYTGVTEDLRRRYKEHQQKKVESTKNKHPIELIGYEAYMLKSDAWRRERYLKTSEGKKLFKKQYKDFLEYVKLKF